MGKSISYTDQRDDERLQDLVVQELEGQEKKSEVWKSHEDKRTKKTGRVQMDEIQLQNLIFEALENTPVKGPKEHRSSKGKSKAKRTTSESANSRPQPIRRPARRVATNSENSRSHRVDLHLTKKRGGSMRNLNKKAPEVIANDHATKSNRTDRTKKHDKSGNKLDPQTILTMLESFAEDDDAKAEAFMAHLKNTNIKPEPPVLPPKPAPKRSQASFAA